MALVALSGAAVGCASGNSTSGPPIGGGAGGSTTGAPACNLTCEAHRICELVDGGPTCACIAGYQNCPGPGGETCDNLDLDAQNCGACGNACPAREVCDGGACTCDLMLCPLPDGGLQCVDPTSDANCGGCGSTCGENQECAIVEGGAAACICLDGGPGVRLESCNGVCTDTSVDPFNCGGCDVFCVSGACIGGDAGTGVCDCPAPYTQCGQDCVDTSTDSYHCGTCSTLCVAIEGFDLICDDGHCICGPTGRGTLCPDGTCALLWSDPQDCGQCGHVCAPPAQDCVDGGCTSG